MNKETIDKLNHLLEVAEKFRSSYFWTPPSNAGGRRSYERQWSVPEFSWEEGGHTYSAAYNVSCSCRYVYASGNYTRDGKKTTLTAIKNSLKRMEMAQ